MLQIYEKTGKGQRKCLDFSLSFNQAGLQRFWRRVKFLDEMGDFCNFGVFFCMRVTKNITTLQTLHRFLREKSGRYIIYIIIKACNW